MIAGIIDAVGVEYLGRDIALSTLRCILGICLGGAAASLIGIIYKSISHRYRRPLEYAVDFVRAIPILAIVPFAAYWMGPKEIGKAMIIGLAAGAIITKATIDALRRSAIDTELMLAGFKLSSRELQQVYLWPRIVAALARGVRLSIGVAWISVVAAEMTGTYRGGFWSGGLGYRLQGHYEDSKWQAMVLGIVVFGMLGLLSTSLIDTLFSRIARYTSINVKL